MFSADFLFAADVYPLYATTPIAEIIPNIATTTKSSISVKPELLVIANFLLLNCYCV